MSRRSEISKLQSRARSDPPLNREHKSGQNWRAARAARQGGSNVDLLGDAQHIFKLDAKVAYSAVNFCVSEQKSNRSEASGHAVDFSRLGPAQRIF